MSTTQTIERTTPSTAVYKHPKYGHINNIKIEGNVGGMIDPSSLTWLEPIPATASDEAIRSRFERDGVVHVKGVMNRETVLAMRRRYFEYVASSGVLKEGTDPTNGIFADGADPHKFAGPGVASHIGLTEAESEFLAKSTTAHQEPFVQQFVQDGDLAKFVKRIKPNWKKPLLFKRQLLRSNIPNSEGTATKVHFDQVFLRAAPATSLTAWIPIGDCPPESGGLIYLENSVPLGFALEEEFTKKNANLSEAERMSAFNVNMVERGMLSTNPGAFAKQADGRRWLVGDYEAGDVVFHHPCMIHASGVNRDPLNRIRLATDVRFADAEAPYDYRWANKFWKPGDGL